MRIKLRYWISILVSAAFSVLPAHAAGVPRNELHDNRDVVRVHFVGALMSTPCSLAMDSLEQIVDLKSVSARHFKNAGDIGPEVTFTLNFEDCLLGARAYSNADVERRLNRISPIYTVGDRAVAISFSGTGDTKNNALVQLAGTQGLGLRLRDELGRTIHMNQSHNRTFLYPGDNTLKFSAALESTQKYVLANSFHTVVNVNIFYF